MSAVLLGFSSLIAVVAVGYFLGRFDLLGKEAGFVLSRVTFYVAAPALMFLTVARPEVSDVFSAGSIVSAVTASALAITFALLGRAVLGLGVSETVLGALTASYVNAGNLGIPILIFAVGEATAIAPILLFQLMVMMPVSFAVLDAQVSRAGSSLAKALTAPTRNPLVVGVALGLLASVTGVALPEPLLLPVEMLADMAVPVMLLAFGLSLPGAPLPGRGGTRSTMFVAVALKNIAGPIVAYVLARYVFSLSGIDLLGPVIVSALPSAQNLFVFAMRYDRAVPLVRDAVLATTIICIPVILTLVAILR